MMYMRVLIPGICGSCGHRGYDCDFEHLNIIEESPKQFKATTDIICPGCKEENTFKSTE